MHKSILILVACAVLIGAVVRVNHHGSRHEGGDHAGGHKHALPDHSQAAGHARLTLNEGQRWATDQVLRTGMQRIHEAVQQNSPQLARTTREQVDYLIAHCELEPEADATLHGIIAQLLAGAQALSQDPRSTEGLEKIHHALRQYPEYFDHPGWQR